MRAWVPVALLFLAGCSGPAAAPEASPPEVPAAPRPHISFGKVGFENCYGWILNEILPYADARAMVPDAFIPERAGPASPVSPPGSQHDEQAGRKILWGLRCAQARVGTQTFANAGYLLASIPSRLANESWGGAYGRHYVAVELAAFPAEFALAVGRAAGLNVDAATMSETPASLQGHGVQGWTITTSNWTFSLARRAQNPTPAAQRFDTTGFVSFWTFNQSVITRAARDAIGGYDNLLWFPSQAQFTGETPAKAMFLPGSTSWVRGNHANPGELQGGREEWRSDLRFWPDGAQDAPKVD